MTLNAQIAFLERQMRRMDDRIGELLREGKPHTKLDQELDAWARIYGTLSKLRELGR